MSESTTVGVLHPGEMGAAVAAAAVRSGHRVLWCSAGRSAATTARAETAGLVPLGSVAEVVAAADVVLSICPPAAAVATVQECVAAGLHGTFVDGNAVGTALAARIGGIVADAGVAFVDGALFGPRRAGDPIRFHLAGQEAAEVAALFGPECGVAPIVLDGPAGSASALKMAHSTFQKAARPLAALAHALADAHGVSAELLAEAEGMASPLAQPHMLTVAASKAWRWEPEMREVAATLAADGLPPGMAEAAAALLQAWEPYRDDRSTELRTVLDALRGGATG